MAIRSGRDEDVHLAESPGERRRAGLLVVLAGQLLVTLDIGLLQVSIPAMRGELHADVPAAHLVMASSTIAYALMLITGGRLGDIFGQRRLFLVGVSLVAVGALGAALAPTVGGLVVARLTTGTGAGLMTPQVLGIIQLTHLPAERPRALALFGTVLGLGGLVGQVLGGLLIDLDLFGLGWRLPVLLTACVATMTGLTGRAVLPRIGGRGREQLDLAGVVLASATLGFLLYSLIAGQREHWPAWTLLVPLATPPAVWVFVRSQRRRSRVGKPPLLDLDLFRLLVFRRGTVFAFVLFLTLVSNFFVLNLCIQEGLDHGALSAALIMGPVPVMFMLGSRVAVPIVRRWGRRAVFAGTLVLVAGVGSQLAPAVLLGGRLEAHHLIPGLLAWGFSHGFVIPPLFDEILHAVPSRHASTAAAVLTTSQQLGNAIGITLVGLVYNAALGSGTAGVDHVRALGASELLLLALSLSLIPLLATVPFRPPSAAVAGLDVDSVDPTPASVATTHGHDPLERVDLV